MFEAQTETNRGLFKYFRIVRPLLLRRYSGTYADRVPRSTGAPTHREYPPPRRSLFGSHLVHPQRVCSDLDHDKVQRMEKGGYVGLLGVGQLHEQPAQFEAFGGSAPGAANNSSLFISGDAVTQGNSKDKTK